MLDLAAPASSPRFDPNLADEYSDAELDALPFGVIALDEVGTILRYNLYESRFARIDRNQVVGRNFFKEVAWCTRNATFEGRFHAFVKEGGADADADGVLRFQFFFDFPFGAQEVLIEFARAPAAPRFYLFINRLRIHPPRPGFPAEMLGVLQRDLAPDEAKQGVLRDGLERRFVEAPVALFAALRATCDRLAPETWPIFASDWGLEWGRRAAVDLEASALERSGCSLRKLPMREVARLVSAYFAERGWGSPTFDFEAVSEGVLVVDVDRSALAEASPRPRDIVGSTLACHLVAGCLAGVLSTVADRRLAAREVACVSGGARRCSIVIVSHGRRAAVEAALASGARGAEPVRAALRRGSRPESSR